MGAIPYGYAAPLDMRDFKKGSGIILNNGFGFSVRCVRDGWEPALPPPPPPCDTCRINRPDLN